jgi:Protein tyrosine and serine/threonine kinase
VLQVSDKAPRLPFGVEISSILTHLGARRYGKILVEQYATFKNAADEINERVLWIESIWKRTTIQLDFLRKVCETLDEEHQDIQNRILQVLVSKLQAAIFQLERVKRKKGGKDSGNNDNVVELKRFKYLWIKECVDDAIKDLEEWQKKFDPSWFLIMKVVNPVIDQELAKGKAEAASISTAKGLRDSLKEESQIKTSLFLPEGELLSANRQKIPFSTAQTMQRAASSKFFILDSVACDPEANTSLLTKDVRDLARKLIFADPLTFSLLKCHGVVKVIDRAKRRVASFDFAFRVPEGMGNPRSLRSVLLSADGNLSLSDRFKVAQQLATSVSYIHTYGFVHKNIRPETVLIFQNQKSVLGASFLVGFEKFRLVDGRTTRSGDCIWEKDLYRHPRRQGLKPEEDYTMQHDIYSLGVCLLEIGLWKSFVTYHDEGSHPSPSTLLAALNDSEKDKIKKAFHVKDALVDLAKQRLPSRIGDKYTEIVVTCLTCLDESNTDFGDSSEFEDADGVLIGVRFIEKVRYYVPALVTRCPKACRFCSNLMEYRFKSIGSKSSRNRAHTNLQKP